MSTRPDVTWPRQLRLPGQAAAPEGPLDMQSMYHMHHAFRPDLHAFAAAGRNTPVEDRKTWRLLAQRWELFTEVLHKHHSAEDDLIWPALMARGTSEDVVVLEAMEAEHEEIDPRLESCAAGFQRLSRKADEDTRAALAVRICAARELLRRHLAHEETEAIAILQRLVVPEEWAEIEAEIGKDTSLRFAVQVVPWVAHCIPRETLDRIFQDVDAGFRMIWVLTRRGFARREARALKYA
jgi:hypothetical protein